MTYNFSFSLLISCSLGLFVLFFSKRPSQISHICYIRTKGYREHLASRIKVHVESEILVQIFHVII